MATEEDRINTGALMTIGAVLAISVVGVAFAVTALVRNEARAETELKGASADLRSIKELRDQQQQSLTGSPTWFDKEANLVTLPVDRAKQLVLEEIKKDPSKATALAPSDAGTQPETTGDAGAAGDAGAGEPAAEDGGAAPAPEQADAAAPPKPKPAPPPAPPTAPEPPPEPEEAP